MQFKIYSVRYITLQTHLLLCYSVHMSDNTACTLINKKCLPCEGGTPPLTEAQIQSLLTEIPDWELQHNTEITKEYTWKNFTQAITFINEVAVLAEAEEHHPDILLHHWKYCRITLTTHAIHGLSENDFIVAAKIEALAKKLTSS